MKTVERRDVRVTANRARKSAHWTLDGKVYRYVPNGIIGRAYVQKRRHTWSVEVLCGWTVSGFASRLAAMRAAERLWGFWLDSQKQWGEAPPAQENV